MPRGRVPKVKKGPRKVKNLLTNKEKWTQKAYALDKAGNSIDFFSPNAASFCLSGAIWKVYQETEHRLAVWKKLEELLKNDYRYIEGIGIINHSLVGWNDHPDTSFADVKKLLEEADV